jgi:hypothetical protein
MFILSEKILELMIDEIIEHEHQCGQFNEKELGSVEQWLESMNSEQLLSEYQNYFGG